ncbi:MAG TPA: DUF1906 domain-containing protein [Nannocystis sp.]
MAWRSTSAPRSAGQTPGALGFDTAHHLVRDEPEKLAAHYSFCVRYVRGDFTTKTAPIDADEVQAILDAGLALMLVQFGRTGTLSGALGQADGDQAAQHAAALGCQAGMSLWCDIEAVGSDVSTNALIAYLNAWYEAVSSAGFAPGVYVGTNRLNGAELYHDLRFEHYWKSGMKVPEAETRGYQMFQIRTATVEGVSLDENRIEADMLGGLPFWKVRPHAS